MNTDFVLTYYAQISIFLLILQHSSLLFLNYYNNKHKSKKINYKDGLLKDPTHLDENFSKTSTMVRRLAITFTLLSSVAVFLHFGLKNIDLGPFEVFSTKLIFGFIAFPAIDTMLSVLRLWFQLKNESDDRLIHGKITFSTAYIFKLKFVTNLALAIVFSFFAYLFSSAYLVGGAVIFFVFTHRDWFKYKSELKKLTS